MRSNLTDMERLALLVGSLSHDLDHRGTNNQFQIKYVPPSVTVRVRTGNFIIRRRQRNVDIPGSIFSCHCQGKIENGC